MRTLVVVAAALTLTLTGETAAACFTCSLRVVMTAQQVECFIGNFDRYLGETKVMDPITINLNNCDGASGPVARLENPRNNSIPPPDCPAENSNCVAAPIDWIFLSKAQLMCLEPPLIDARTNKLDPFTFDLSACPN